MNTFTTAFLSVALAVLLVGVGFLVAVQFNTEAPVNVGGNFTDEYNIKTFYNDVELKDDVDITGAATTTRSGGNILINSTSTGLVIRTGAGTCVLLGIANGTGVLSTSTASCN